MFEKFKIYTIENVKMTPAGRRKINLKNSGYDGKRIDIA